MSTYNEAGILRHCVSTVAQIVDLLDVFRDSHPDITAPT